MYSVDRTAQILGISSNTLWERVRAHGRRHDGGPATVLPGEQAPGLLLQGGRRAVAGRRQRGLEQELAEAGGDADELEKLEDGIIEVATA